MVTGHPQGGVGGFTKLSIAIEGISTGVEINEDCWVVSLLARDFFALFKDLFLGEICASEELCGWPACWYLLILQDLS